MIKQKRTVGLIAFLRGSTSPENKMPGCCNYDHDSGGCSYKDCCLVEQGQRCGYFEKAVLPTAADIGLGERMYSLYEKQCNVSGTLERSQIRICPDCGTGLKPRQRYCDNCAKKHRRESYRKSRDNKRSKRNT